MDCISKRLRKFRIFSILAVVLFVMLALQLGYSEQSNAPSEAIVGTTPIASTNSYGPFSKIAFGITAGTYGPGLEVATPLSRRTNLRFDGSFFSYDPSFTSDSVNYNGNINVRELRASYDFFPFHGGFRLSGGVAMYNDFKVSGTATLPAGNKISLNSEDYYSSGGSNALQAAANLSYANKVAPTFTFGWGNAIPRSGRHMAFPVEIGAAYTGVPTFNLTATGQACAGAPCGSPGSTAPIAVTTDPTFKSNLNTQINKIKNDLQPARFYPILNFGATYRF